MIALFLISSTGSISCLQQIMSVSSQISWTFIQSSWPITWTYPIGIVSRWCQYTVTVLQSNWLLLCSLTTLPLTNSGEIW